MLVFLSIVLVIVSVLILFVLLLFLFLAIDVFLDLPYVATKREKIETIIKLAQIKKALGPEKNRRRETVVDLGSGDGRLLLAAAQKGAISIGYEINPFLIFLTRLRTRFGSAQVRDLISVKKQNLWKADLKVADIIFVYGRKKTMQKFEDFVYKNARKRTRIIVNTNKFPSKRPVKSENGIFLYRI